MIAFPNAKINLGLHVLERRDDGFHNIETVMVPIPMCDVLEIVPDRHAPAGCCKLEIMGIALPGDVKENLCYRAYTALSDRYKLPAVKMILFKKIPTGAGLGGGSSDAASAVKLLNREFRLNMADSEMEAVCAELGSDCSFFVRNRVSLAFGKGEKLKPLKLDISGLHMVVVNPGIHIDTAAAYSGIMPDPGKKGQLNESLGEPLETWKNTVKNDFEDMALKKFPELERITKHLYNAGAVYASMTGSGSSFYGLFYEQTKPESIFSAYEVWYGKLSSDCRP